MMIPLRILHGQTKKNHLNLLKLYSSKDTSHPFVKNTYNSSDLASELCSHLIYYKNGILVLNKPQGVSFAENSSQNDASFEVSLHSLLPYLKEKLKVLKIYPAIVPEKYASGVSIFCTDEDLLKKVKKCLRSMKALRNPAEHYDCIVIGKPAQEFGSFDGGITIVTSPNGKKKGIKFIEECSKSWVRNGRVKNTFIEHETISSNELASRLRISITRTMWHGLRLYAANRLVSPVLGDRVFGGLVKTVLGKPVLVDMWSPAASSQTVLPKQLISQLEMASRGDVEIPLHLHLWKVSLSDFPRKGRSIEFFAEPPDFFNWTCAKLNLDTKYLNNRFVNSN